MFVQVRAKSRFPKKWTIKTILVNVKKSRAIGNVLSVVKKSLNFLLNQMVIDPFSAVTVTDRIETIDQEETSNYKYLYDKYKRINFEQKNMLPQGSIFFLVLQFKAVRLY